MKYNSRLLIYILLMGSSRFAFASGSQSAGIPSDVKFQALNITLFLGIIIYFAGGKIKAFFAQRFEDFHRSARETAQARKNLENKKEDLIRLTQNLLATSEQSLAQAKREADEAMRDLVVKANEEALRIANEAQAQLKSDYSKLMEKLRMEALEMSMRSAEGKIQAMSAADKTKINAGAAQRVEGAAL